MIRGRVSENRQALIGIEIADQQGRFQLLEAVLDTGFTGYLTLPTDFIRQLGLRHVGQRTFELASGDLYEFEAYLAAVSWHGTTRDALVLRSDSTPLLGMTLIWGRQITLEGRTNGEVTVEALDPAH